MCMHADTWRKQHVFKGAYSYLARVSKTSLRPLSIAHVREVAPTASCDDGDAPASSRPCTAHRSEYAKPRGHDRRPRGVTRGQAPGAGPLGVPRAAWCRVAVTWSTKPAPRRCLRFSAPPAKSANAPRLVARGAHSNMEARQRATKELTKIPPASCCGWVQKAAQR